MAGRRDDARCLYSLLYSDFSLFTCDKFAVFAVEEAIQASRRPAIASHGYTAIQLYSAIQYTCYTSSLCFAAYKHYTKTLCFSQAKTDDTIGGNKFDHSQARNRELTPHWLLPDLQNKCYTRSSSICFVNEMHMQHADAHAQHEP